MKRTDRVDDSHRSTHSAPVIFGGDHLTVLTTDTTVTGTTSNPITPFHFMEQETTLSMDTSMDGIDVLSPEPSPKNVWQYWHQRTGPWVTNPTFRRTVLALILINTLVLGLRTWDWVREQRVLLAICDVEVRICQGIFTAELLLELVYHQLKICHRGWILLDICIIVTSWWTNNTTVLVFRGFRLLRAFRKATSVPALRETVRALLKALRMLLALAVLLTLLILMFAVWFTDMYVVERENNNQDPDDDNNMYSNDEAYFSSLQVSAMTLYQIMTGGRLWASIAQDLKQAHPGAPLVLVAFVGVSIFGFGGMAVAILVQALVSTVAQTDGLAPSWNTSKRSTMPEPTAAATTTFSTQLSPPVVPTPHSLLRLEQKVDSLSRTVEQLLGMQVALQESMNEVSQQQMARARMESTLDTKAQSHPSNQSETLTDDVPASLESRQASHRDAQAKE